MTGNTCFVTPAWVEMAFPEDHVLITCARGQPHPPRIRTITLDSKERIGQLVDSYEFDRIVYFSEYLTPHSEQEGELDRLRRVLQANRERPSQLLYLAGPEAVLTPFIGKSVLAQAAEALCRHYAETSRVQIKVLHLPYLYGTDCTGAPVGIAQLLTRPKSGELHFEEQALAPVAEELERYRSQPLPAIIPIPGRAGSLGLGLSQVKKSVEKAVGADILFGS